MTRPGPTIIGGAIVVAIAAASSLSAAALAMPAQEVTPPSTQVVAVIGGCPVGAGPIVVAFSADNSDAYTVDISLSVTVDGRTDGVSLSPNPLQPGGHATASVTVPNGSAGGSWAATVTGEGVSAPAGSGSIPPVSCEGPPPTSSPPPPPTTLPGTPPVNPTRPGSPSPPPPGPQPSTTGTPPGGVAPGAGPVVPGAPGAPDTTGTPPTDGPGAPTGDGDGASPGAGPGPTGRSTGDEPMQGISSEGTARARLLIGLVLVLVAACGVAAAFAIERWRGIPAIVPDEDEVPQNEGAADVDTRPHDEPYGEVYPGYGS